MMKNIFIVAVIFASLATIWPNYSLASSFAVINEIAWMGTEASFSNEWVELYNPDDTPINLEGWRLTSNDGSPDIALNNQIAAKDFYLLERTDDDTLPEITADWTGSFGRGGLNNTGEALYLYDAQGHLIDSVDSSQGWFSGDNTTKKTMERKNLSIDGNSPSSWQTSQNSGGTPKAPNSAGGGTPSAPINQPEQQLPPLNTIKPENAPIQPETKNLTYLEQKIYPKGIILNELLPSPDGPDEDYEWIEIYNQNAFLVELAGWKLQDSSGGTRAYAFSQKDQIAANGFFVVMRPTSGIVLNNNGDKVILADPNGTFADESGYEKAYTGQSYSRTKDGWAWSKTPTPNAANVTAADSSEETETDNKNTIDNAVEKNFLAKASPAPQTQKQTPSRNTPFFPIALALLLSLLAAITMLFIKKRFPENSM